MRRPEASLLFAVWETYKGRFNYTLVRLHREHGSFVRISYNEVSVNHPDALRILSTPLRKADFYRPMAVPNSNYNNLMSEQDPKKYAAMRSNVAAAYTLSNILRNETDMDKTIALLEKRLDDLSKQKGREPVELSQWLFFLTHDLLGEILFSNRFGFLDQGRDVGDSIKNNFFLSVYITSIVYIQWLHFLTLGSPLLRWIDFQPNEHTYTTAVKSIEARRASSTPRVDMMQHWLEQRQKYPEKFSERELFSSAISTFGAGGGTVGSVLGAFFYFLLKEDPKYYQRLREEIDSAQISTSEVVSFAEAQRLPYLQAVIKETLRIWPPNGWNLPRVVPKEGFVVAGRHFKEGTILSVNPWLIHRNQDCFGSDADTYNPERWLGDADQVRRIEKFLIPFGLGYNSCPGRNVASLELNKVTATLIRDFDFELEHPEREWWYHQLFVTTQRDWPVILKRRR
ncbi:MAG: hypothetical protein Q9191_000822 [Dirinaria sp. TL-2023a]